METYTSEIQHVGISVRDLDSAVAWYTKYFGFVETKRFRKEELEISGAQMQLGGMAIEVLAPFSPAEATSPPASLVAQLRRTGVNHIAIGVTDIAACHARLSSDGCTMMTDLIDGRFFFCADPDGVVLEIRKI